MAGGITLHIINKHCRYSFVNTILNNMTHGAFNWKPTWRKTEQKCKSIARKVFLPQCDYWTDLLLHSPCRFDHAAMWQPPHWILSLTGSRTNWVNPMGGCPVNSVLRCRSCGGQREGREQMEEQRRLVDARQPRSLPPSHFLHRAIMFFFFFFLNAVAWMPFVEPQVPLPQCVAPAAPNKQTAKTGSDVNSSL